MQFAIFRLLNNASRSHARQERGTQAALQSIVKSMLTRTSATVWATVATLVTHSILNSLHYLLTWLRNADQISAVNLQLNLENSFHFYCGVGRNLSKSQRASGMITVTGFPKNFVKQITATIDHEMLFMELQG